ncbi:MAG: DUF1385 domain-containing protein [Clostridia bacterium]|nr:DUF1385 domain-containing protein [Clostridia bacterium]
MEQQPLRKDCGIGGQALIEGVMMRAPGRMALCVRRESGELVTESSEIKPPSKFAKLPFVRGVVGLFSSMVIGYKALMRSAELFLPENEDDEADKAEAPVEPAALPEKKKSVGEKILLYSAVVLALGISIGLFFLLPTVLVNFAKNYIETKWMVVVLESIVRMAIFIGYLFLVTRMKDIRRTFSYHGAEHKTIHCIEAGLPLNVENARAGSRLHPRCGTSFLLWVMVISFVVFMVFGRFDTIWMRLASRIVLLPVIAALSFELLKLLANYENKFARAMRTPGMWLQALTAFEPDDEMIESAIDAFRAAVKDNEKVDEKIRALAEPAQAVVPTPEPTPAIPPEPK